MLDDSLVSKGTGIAHTQTYERAKKHLTSAFNLVLSASYDGDSVAAPTPTHVIFFGLWGVGKAAPAKTKSKKKKGKTKGKQSSITPDRVATAKQLILAAHKDSNDRDQRRLQLHFQEPNFGRSGQPGDRMLINVDL